MMKDWVTQQRATILSTPISPEDLSTSLFTERERKRQHYKCGNKFVEIISIPVVSNTCKETLNEAAKKVSDKIAIWRGDITHLECDAIVNAANEGLLGGGGIDEAIHGAAGPLLQRECASLDQLCDPGNAVITKGYRLPAQYVIHTVGPYLDEKEKPQPAVLAECYKSIFALCEKYKIQTVAIPPISTGFYGFPKEWAAKIAVEETAKYAQNLNIKVVFVAFHKDDENAYNKAVL